MKLLDKTPQEAAEMVGEVAGNSYLAHSIRGIEREIRDALSQVFRIDTFYSENNTKVAKAFFSERGCLIRLPKEEVCTDTEKDKKKRRVSRIKLAHELGHIVYNAKHLKHLSGKDNNTEREEALKALNNDNPTDEEELYAWEFAYHLVKKKSDEHRSNNQTKFYVYDNDSEARDQVLAVIAEKIQTNTMLYNNIKNKISPIPKS